MESMACGTVPLVSNIPSNREWVENDGNGFLFEDGEGADLAAKLIAIDKDRNKLPVLARQAQIVAEQRADWQKNIQIMLGGYDLAMKLHREQGL
jgi:glycosyltransferase involved in cell wall biosynthesis